MAVAFWKIEDAFARKFTGKSLKDRNDRYNPVPVFLDYPDIHDNPEQRFPSVSIMFKGMEPDRDMFDSTMDKVVDINYDTNPPTFIMRRVEEHYTISYEVTTYCLSASEDRELTRWVESRLQPQDSIQVDSNHYHVFRNSFSVSDNVDFDTVVYEKTWTFTIKADIEDTDNDDYQKGVNQVRIKSNIVKTTPKTKEPTATTTHRYNYNAPKAGSSALEADKTLHRVVAFDDQKYWFPIK